MDSRIVSNTGQRGFSLLELLVGMTVLGLLIMLSVPAMSDLIIRMRVDNEISEMHRILLTARNRAINIAQPVTLCPLSGNNCGTAWQNELSLFIDNNNNQQLDSGAGETIIQVKSAITTGDQFTFPRTAVTYSADGTIGFQNGTFRYCPNNHVEHSRGIVLTNSGRFYQTSDTNDDGRDEDSAGANVSCG